MPVWNLSEQQHDSLVNRLDQLYRHWQTHNSLYSIENNAAIATEAGHQLLYSGIRPLLADNRFFDSGIIDHSVAAFTDHLREEFHEARLQDDRLSLQRVANDHSKLDTFRNSQFKLPKPGTPLERQEIVLEGKHWKLIADDSPGYSDLEWVTDPIDDRETLATTLTEVVRMMQLLENRDTSEYIRLGDIVQELSDLSPTIHRSALIIPVGLLNISPQLSAGIRLERLPSLMKAGGVGSWKTRRFPTEFHKRVHKIVGDFSVNSSPSFVAFVMLLGHYLIGRPTVSNAKAMAGPVMSRTDFVHALSLLPESIRETLVERSDEFFKSLSDNFKFTLDEGIFNNPNEAMQEINEMEEMTVFSSDERYPELTYREWLTGLLDGTDLLKDPAGMSSHERGVIDARSDGRLWKSIESMGHLGMLEPEWSRNLVVLEFRRVANRRTYPKQIVSMGLAAYDEIKTKYDPSLQ